MKTIWFILCAVAMAACPRPARATDIDPPPLPTLEEIFKGVVERARKESENDRNFQTQYVFVKSKTTEYRNAKGEVKKLETKTSTNNPALRKLALPPPRKRIEDQNQPASDPHSQARGKAFEEEEFRVNADLIKRFEFKLVGRELYRGRPALIVEFQPAKSNQPERSLKDKFLNKAAGQVWIDEGDCALVKVSLRLTDRVNVFGGLVGAVRKFAFECERERVAEALWFTRLTTWHLEGREVFVQRVVDFREERTDIRKYEASLASATAALRQ